MKLNGFRSLLTISLACLLLSLAGMAQVSSDFVSTPRSAIVQGKVGVRAFPRVAIDGGRELGYEGSFAADGIFKPITKFSLYVENMKTASVSDEAKAANPDRFLFKRLARGPRVIPVVYDVKPSTHLIAPVTPKPLMTEVRDVVVHFLAGAERIFSSPQDVTTDTRGRVIISDPEAHSVHVLDSGNKNSFSIVGGDGLRMQSPNGVAVDGDDNIYVSDKKLGMVLVYDSSGAFLRYIGDYKGENEYQAPAGMAIDRRAGRIYLLDTPRNMFFILDLAGNELARVGRPESKNGPFLARRGNGQGGGELSEPAGIAIHKDEVIVLEAKSRLQIYDLNGKFKRQLELLPGKASGLCVDAQGTIYVSKLATNTVEAYDHEGKLLHAIGHSGDRLGEFESPEGLWADASDHLYVVDSDNLRLQVFEVRSLKEAGARDLEAKQTSHARKAKQQ